MKILTYDMKYTYIYYLRLTFKNALFSSVFIMKGGIAANEEKKKKH